MGNATITRLNSGTLLSGPMWAYIRVIINNSYNVIYDEYCIEFDVVDTNNTSTNAALNLYDGTSHNIYLLSNTHYKIIISDKFYPYANDVPQNPIYYDISKTSFQTQFALRNENTTLTFKNFIMYNL